MGLVSEFKKLIKDTEAKFVTPDFKIEDFPKVASGILNDFNWSFNHVEFQELLRYLGPLPRQSFSRHEFGELPFTIYRHEKFHVDLYVWNNNETSIHDHHFCGAFKVIKGKSLQISYQFEALSNVDPGIDWGELKKIDSRYLQQGIVQEIALGDKFIHQVIHMDFPTVTFILRTPDLLDNLCSYWTSGLRVKYNFDHLKLTKILDYLDCIYEFHQLNIDQHFEENLFYPVLDQLSVIELVACLQRMRIFVSEPVHKIIRGYCLQTPLAADYEKILYSTINEQKMIQKLLFLKHVTRV